MHVGKEIKEGGGGEKTRGRERGRGGGGGNKRHNSGRREKYT